MSNFGVMHRPWCLLVVLIDNVETPSRELRRFIAPDLVSDDFGLRKLSGKRHRTSMTWLWSATRERPVPDTFFQRQLDR
jgi:hypothetical protein